MKISSKSRQKEVCSNESYFLLSTVYPFLYLVFKHSPCHQHRGFYGWVLRLQEPESTRKILLTSQLIFVCQLQIYGISINWDFNHWLAHTDILSGLLTHADLNLVREVCKFSFYLLTFKFTAFFFPLPPSLSWCISPTKNFTLSHWIQRTLLSFSPPRHFILLPMKVTSHLASSAHRNFDTRLLNRENSEVAYCRRFRFSSFHRFYSVKLQSVAQTSSLKVMKGSLFS